VFDSGNLIKIGGTYQFTFANAGTFNYFCTVHPWMVGQVIVGAASTTSTPTTNTTASGNAAVPEFGPVASIVLAIAVMSMVVFAAKTRGIPKL
ncbi:MAG TPA: PEFG-CTERM sorting domain-containing protein, partial [Candidatus Nitrosotalea sp.]|nr:PEFG-CTERM sorting domain-containing protein [Candidatus Nitrosotalea sp.]